MGTGPYISPCSNVPRKFCEAGGRGRETTCRAGGEGLQQSALQDQRGRSRGFEVSILWCLSGATKTTWEDTTGKDVFGMAVCQLIYDISLEIILMFDMWFMMFPMCDTMNHVTSRTLNPGPPNPWNSERPGPRSPRVNCNYNQI